MFCEKCKTNLSATGEGYINFYGSNDYEITISRKCLKCGKINIFSMVIENYFERIDD